MQASTPGAFSEDGATVQSRERLGEVAWGLSQLRRDLVGARDQASAGAPAVAQLQERMEALLAEQAHLQQRLASQDSIPTQVGPPARHPHLGARSVLHASKHVCLQDCLRESIADACAVVLPATVWRTCYVLLQQMPPVWEPCKQLLPTADRAVCACVAGEAGQRLPAPRAPVESVPDVRCPRAGQEPGAARELHAQAAGGGVLLRSARGHRPRHHCPDQVGMLVCTAAQRHAQPNT